ncbi:hypothetical protein COV82_06275 [Candidatus Peregrinibacteria bacterium CG11_big_fil_rev_8_21_14_0_20_46_8]|nr:MAG: hypothetical protein COV82_06275 [Candidatus Peregrinibacteria bacterium CG11_big_fil_rev_8_21_14_0_20_46_8]
MGNEDGSKKGTEAPEAFAGGSQVEEEIARDNFVPLGVEVPETLTAGYVRHNVASIVSPLISVEDFLFEGEEAAEVWKDISQVSVRGLQFANHIKLRFADDLKSDFGEEEKTWITAFRLFLGRLILCLERISKIVPSSDNAAEHYLAEKAKLVTWFREFESELRLADIAEQYRNQARDQLDREDED